ncbi:hypothetical protein [Candidatus Pseudoruminococcus sp.]|uniref:hypothetical protein n=1 Tax=Candidatus Pseudoruminococcus sp. TaxID=3101048 RepID=UPI00399A65E0
MLSYKLSNKSAASRRSKDAMRDHTGQDAESVLQAKPRHMQGNFINADKKISNELSTKNKATDKVRRSRAKNG